MLRQRDKNYINKIDTKENEMLKIFRLIIMIFVCCFFVSGCVSTGSQPSEKSMEPAMEISIPDRFFVNNESTPIDIKMVCAAILNKLRDRGETEFVRFDPAAGQKVQEELFTYEGFEVTLIDITGFEVKNVGQNQAQGILEGVFHFEDFVGRRASTYFAAKYLKTPDGIIINKAGITNISPLFPRVEAYFIPVEAFNNSQNNTFRGYWEMYAFALKNSLDMNPSQEEIQAYQAYQNLSTWKKATAKKKTKKMKLAVMIFCFDRLSNGARFEVTSTEKNLGAPGYIDENGWQIAVVTGEFVPDLWGATFDIDTYYTPEGRNEKLLIGKFSNQKDYMPKQKDPAPQQTRIKNDYKQTTPSIDDTEEGPVASGSVFLNPFLKLDARIIQKRLADLGYYDLKIDGIFGKNSQKAIQKFKKNNGLRDNATWDIQTQKLLFKGSDL